MSMSEPTIAELKKRRAEADRACGKAARAYHWADLALREREGRA